jgi:non-specific serine/threonine protein kinase
MNTLTPEMLTSLRAVDAAKPGVRQAGWNLVWSGTVHVTSVERREAHIEVRERRMPSHEVVITLKDGNVAMTCGCPDATAAPEAACRHQVAAALKLRDHLRSNPIQSWETTLSTVLQTPQRRAASVAPRDILIFSLLQGYAGWHLTPFRLSVRYFPEEIWRDNAALIEFLKTRKDLWREAKVVRSAVDPARIANATEDIAQATHVLAVASQGYSSYGMSTSLQFTGILPRITGYPLFRGRDYDPLVKPLRAIAEPVTPKVQLDDAPDGLRLRVDFTTSEGVLSLNRDDMELISETPPWLLAGDTLFSIEGSSASFLSLLQSPEVTIPADEEEAFLTQYLAPLAERLPVSGNAVTWEEVQSPVEKRLYLAEGADGIEAVLRFGYGAHEVAYEKSPPGTSQHVQPGTRTLVRIPRDVEAEQAAFTSLGGYGLKRGREPGQFVLRARTHPVDFLLHQVPRLAEHGFTVYGEEELATARVNRNTPTLSFNVATGIDWFDVGAVAHFGDLEVSIKDLRRAVRRKERYIKLADGTIGALPEAWLETYSRLFALSEETETGVRLGTAQVTLLDQLLEKADGYAADEEYESRRRRLRDFSSIQEHALPRGLNAELRPYQKAGFDWMHFLHEYGFGGCLADDMGLGKTLEALTFLLSLREEGHSDAPDLIVMPRSLLFNWQREAARFTPGLRVLIHADKDRTEDLEELDQYDLVLTTYGIMMRDIEALRARRFHYVVLDESQAIKNPLAKTARAARLLNSDHRLALTGTPVENSTSELWSQFAFLNPGLLGGLEYFRSEFTTPIERHQNVDAAEFLRKMVYPFILRRTKAQVAPELPRRTERVLLTDMEPAQRKMYDKYRDYFRAQVLGLLDEGAGNARMKVLEGLLRLRQISNDPRTVDEKYKGGSGKFNVLMETLVTLRDEGHKALVFSQFTQMLGLVRAALDSAGIPYVYLDGQTKDRQTPVDTFQNDDDIPFFLVSLKAGGVGLNLTAADYVVHIDPWWNPAVEMQATDRTHRIGQDKPVFIYKLIARDSVEEKIVQLQDRKRALVSSLITTDTSFFKSLTRQDVEMLFE